MEFINKHKDNMQIGIYRQTIRKAQLDLNIDKEIGALFIFTSGAFLLQSVVPLLQDILECLFKFHKMTGRSSGSLAYPISCDTHLPSNFFSQKTRISNPLRTQQWAFISTENTPRTMQYIMSNIIQSYVLFMCLVTNNVVK